MRKQKRPLPLVSRVRTSRPSAPGCPCLQGLEVKGSNDQLQGLNGGRRQDREALLLVPLGPALNSLLPGAGWGLPAWAGGSRDPTVAGIPSIHDL